MYGSNYNNNSALKYRSPQRDSLTDLGMGITFQCIEDISKKFRNIGENLIEESIDIVNRSIFYLQSSCSLLSELRDFSSWVYRHSVDVALISHIFASNLGYDEYTKQELCIGALLHDVGKLMIPKGIIQKPGKLDTREMKIMQQHSVLGYNLITNLDIPNGSKTIVLQHHERLDGSGYPFGLFKESISGSTKIVMVVDALDAMTTRRPYGSTLTVNDAMANIKRDGAKYSEDVLFILERLAF